MARRPLIRTELPGPKAKAIVEEGEAWTSPSYTRDYPLVAAKGEGAWIIDPDGNEFLDMTAGIAVTSTGHCHPEIVKVIQDQAANLIHMSGTDFYYPVQGALARELAKRVPIKGGDVRVYFGNSGTEANEAAMKLARWYTGRPNFIAFLGAFHGRTMGALSLTASKPRQKERFAPFVPGVYHAYYPDAYREGSAEVALKRAIATLDDLFATVLPAEEVAGIFVEPIQGEGGYVLPPDAFLKHLRALCDKHGMLLIFDEVQSGMGRTGKLWACEHSGVQPDILTSAKGIASGLPLSAMFATSKVMSWPPGAHASTFGGNPIACATALKTIELLEREYIANAAKVGAFMLERLKQKVGHLPMVGDVRGRGLMIGVEIVLDKTTRARNPDLRNQLVMDAFAKGLLILGAGRNTIRFCPSLTVTEDEAAVAVDVFAELLESR